MNRATSYRKKPNKLGSIVILVNLFVWAGCASRFSAESKENSVLTTEQCSKADVLLDALEEEDEHSVEAAFRSLSCLDGGELEDVYRALGVQFAKRPQDVIAAMKNTKTLASNAMPMLVMLPLSYVDDPCAGKVELQNRRQIASEVVHDETIKEIFLDALDGAIVRKSRSCLTN